MWLCSPTSVQRARLEHPPGRLGRVARAPARDREAELLVLVRGGDELVGVRLDAHGEPDHHRHRRAALAGHGVEPGDLVQRVEHDVADARLDRRDQLVDRLVVAVEGDPLRREARPQRDGQLAAAAHVQAQPLVGDPAGHLRAQERLGRVVHRPRAERGGELRRARPEVGLVDDEQRRAVLARRGRGRPRRPASTAPSSPRRAPRGHTAGASASRSAALRGCAPADSAGGSTPACSGPAG